jgi:hypothetical protein
MTQIIYERSGGFMGRKVTIHLNLDELPARQSRTLLRLLREADFFNLPEDLISQSLPDAFTYTITVEEETQSHTIHLSDTTATETLRPLLDDLSELARPAKKIKNKKRVPKST